VKNNHTPEIRFPGFTEDWEQHSLDSIVGRVKSYSLSRDVETSEYTGYKYIHYGDIHTKVADLIDESSVLPNIKAGNYELLKKGDLVLADASEDYQGIATPAVITIDVPYKLVSGLHTIALRPNQVNSLFLYYLFNSPTFRKYGYKTGTGMKVFGISVTNLLKFEGMFPLLEEQTEIGNFLKKLDDIIALHQQELTTLKQTKQGFLQKMFPKKGESVPEIRFPGYTEEWEQRKFKDFISKAGKKNTMDENYSAYSVSNKLGLVSQTEQFDGSRLDDLDKTSYKLVNPNDFAYNPARINVGSIAFNNLNKTVIVSSLYVVLKMSENLDNEFILQFIKSQFFNGEVRRNTEGSVREYLFFENFSNIKFPYTSKDEQIKIGNFFKQLDDTIALHQCELESLQETKKVFLQKMFI
jgi:type I restriction enzyme, S subunit